ncbi:HEAT repeat domain-containing protein [Gordonia sp. CPCC 205515]|uniref:HEAT repeat domain-containing protein n=1 Tax=Gordonia sp. CPCC 205515 TaxID=3140791 RepID=UPI003AF3A294
MNTINQGGADTRLIDALRSDDASQRLRAALAAGSQADPRITDVLVARCRVEPDFFVRDMLTWALCRRPADETVPLLIAELGSDVAQARGQALHTLSKIGDRRAWPAVRTVLHDDDDDVARTAWRAAVVVVPEDERTALAAELAAELGRGDTETQRSLSRALVGLGEAARPAVLSARHHPTPGVRAHAEATDRLFDDPDGDFVISVETAKRVAALGESG